MPVQNIGKGSDCHLNCGGKSEKENLFRHARIQTDLAPNDAVTGFFAGQDKECQEGGNSLGRIVAQAAPAIPNRKTATNKRSRSVFKTAQKIRK